VNDAFWVTEQFKQFLQEQADEENRTLSNFIENAVLTYVKEHDDIDYKKDKRR